MVEWLLANKERLFDGLGVAGLTAIVTAVLWVVRRRYVACGSEPRGTSSLPAQAAEPSGAVVIGPNATISGLVAGRDIVVTPHPRLPRLQELVLILKHRANKIMPKLAPHYDYAPVAQYVDRFSSLDQEHIEALEKGNLTLAHEVLIAIHQLSAELESDEFWTRRRRESPDLFYFLRLDMFQRGRMVCMYVAGDMTPYSSRYPSADGVGVLFGKAKEPASSLYKRILDSTEAADGPNAP